MTLVPLLLLAIPGAYSSPREVFVQLKTGVGVRMVSKSGLVIEWVNVKTKETVRLKYCYANWQARTS